VRHFAASVRGRQKWDAVFKRRSAVRAAHRGGRRRRPSASSTSVRVPDRVVRCRRLLAGARKDDRASRRPAHLIATVCRSAPARCYACADERRIVAGEGGRTSVSGRVVRRGRSRCWSSNGSALFTTPCSLPRSIALRPRAAARAPTIGASLPGHAGRRYAIDDLARPWSRR
jgi:hypothetical protein